MPHYCAHIPHTQQHASCSQEQFPSSSPEIYFALQLQVARECGFDDAEFGVEVLRSSQALYPQHPLISKIPLYVRHNRSEEGKALALLAPAPVGMLLASADTSSFLATTAAGAGAATLTLAQHLQAMQTDAAVAFRGG